MRKLPYQSSLQFIQRPQLLWNDIGDRKLWRGIQWIRRGPTAPSRLSWNAYQSNIPKPRSGVRWKHGMRRFSEYGNVASRNIFPHFFPYFPTFSNLIKAHSPHPTALSRPAKRRRWLTSTWPPCRVDMESESMREQGPGWAEVNIMINSAWWSIMVDNGW